MTWSDLVTALIFACLIATSAAYFAQRRGRNPYVWFFVGFFFGILGLLAIFFAPLKRPVKRVVGPIEPPKPQPVIVGPSDKFWYYLDPANQQLGPMSFDALNRAWKQGKLGNATFVWHEELPDWKPLHELIKN